jgi:hypothetical protein
VLILWEYKQHPFKNQGLSEKKQRRFTFDFWMVHLLQDNEFVFTGLVPRSYLGAVKREEGATPSLSRNCKGRPTPHDATGNTWEGAQKG